jgi:hypothetical protein
MFWGGLHLVGPPHWPRLRALLGFSAAFLAKVPVHRKLRVALVLALPQGLWKAASTALARAPTCPAEFLRLQLAQALVVAWARLWAAQHRWLKLACAM